MMEELCIVTIHGKGRTLTTQAPPGSSLYSLLTASGFAVNAPCGGNGTCGKCLVRVSGGSVEGDSASPVTEGEKRFLGDRLGEGYRLACHTTLAGPLEVWLPEPDSDMKILSRGRTQNGPFRPLVGKTVLHLESPAQDDQTPHRERLMKAWRQVRKREADDLCGVRQDFSLGEMKRLSEAVLRGVSTLTVVDVGGKIVALEEGDTSKVNYGVAFDVGTTTIAGYLIDFAAEREASSAVAANPQRPFGADVISRIGYTMNRPDRLREMNRVIVDGINGMIARFAESVRIGPENIYAAAFAGNTTMMHFLMGLPADGIARAPFVPVTTDMMFLSPRETGLNINRNGSAVILPGVSAYIGADTVAAVLSTGMHKNREISLLIDIGTNGEIVLGNRDGMVACSAAAGPAFEGAGISCGVSSITGAIDGVRLEPEFRISTIGEGRASGICGSGIVDAVAELRASGIVDEKGRFLSDPSSLPGPLRERVTEISGQRAFILAGREESSSGTDIAVTQKDIRELQNAKAAIAAGIRILSLTSRIGLDRVDKVYLAGGFGSYINIPNAIRIGLLPRELEGRVESVGNAAGAGAVESLFSRDSLQEKRVIRDLIDYVELSYKKEFLKEYINSMKL